jgi:hypothetical protein
LTEKKLPALQKVGRCDVSLAAQLTGWFIKFIAASDFIKTTPPFGHPAFVK